MSIGTLITMIAIALGLWGQSPALPTVPHIEPLYGPAAIAGCDESECRVYVDPITIQAYDLAAQQSIITHEVGHLLGLGHYGSCNHNESIMGCATLGEITLYDRGMLSMQTRTYRIIVPVFYEVP